LLWIRIFFGVKKQVVLFATIWNFCAAIVFEVLAHAVETPVSVLAVDAQGGAYEGVLNMGGLQKLNEMKAGGPLHLGR